MVAHVGTSERGVSRGGSKMTGRAVHDDQHRARAAPSVWICLAAGLISEARNAAPAVLAGPPSAQPPPSIAPQPRERIEAALAEGVGWLKARVREGLPPLPQQWQPWVGNQTYNEIVLYTL